MAEQGNIRAGVAFGLHSGHMHRFQYRDPASDELHLFYNATEALEKIGELGEGDFQYVPRAGEFIQIGRIDGQWRTYDRERGSGVAKPTPGFETLEAIQVHEDTQALAEIERRALEASGGAVSQDEASDRARAYADAGALRRIEDELLRQDAAIWMHEAARASMAYRDGLSAPPFQDTLGTVTALVARADERDLAKEVRKGVLIEEAPNMIEDRAAADEQTAAQPDALDRPKNAPLGLAAEHVAIDPALAQHLIEGFDQRGNDYFFKGSDRKAFSDKGRRIVSKLDDRESIAGMLTCAEVKGWRAIQIKGSESFRRQVWYAARQRGLEVAGYEPTREEAALFAGARAQEVKHPAGLPLNTIEAAGGTGAARPLPAEAERAGAMGPARIEASLDEARKQIADAIGEKAQIFRAETRAGTYRGELVAETQLHIVQRISAHMAVIHNKVDVAGGIIGQRGIYAYRGGRAKFAANREQQLVKAGLER